MTNERSDENEFARELRAVNEPPALPAESIWRDIEPRVDEARENERVERANRRRVSLPIAGAIAASLALLATGAAVGYGLSAQPTDTAHTVDAGAATTETIDETETPTQAIPGDTVQVAWF